MGIQKIVYFKTFSQIWGKGLSPTQHLYIMFFVSKNVTRGVLEFQFQKISQMFLVSKARMGREGSKEIEVVSIESVLFGPDLGKSICLKTYNFLYRFPNRNIAHNYDASNYLQHYLTSFKLLLY